MLFDVAGVFLHTIISIIWILVNWLMWADSLKYVFLIDNGIYNKAVGFSHFIYFIAATFCRTKFTIICISHLEFELMAVVQISHI